MYRKIFTIVLFCFFPFLSIAQTIFQNLKWQDGLSAKQVRGLYKDKEGFLWIGTTNGLNRYDGAVIKQYKNGNFKSLYINAVEPFGNDSLLIGTRKGLFLFDKKTGLFYDDERFSELREHVIVCIKQDGRGRIWIGTRYLTSSKIYICDQNKLLPVEAVYPDAKVFNKHDFALSIMVYDTARQGFWIAASKPFFIDFRNRTVYHRDNNPLHFPPLKVDNVNAIAVDSKSNVWYGCDDDPSLNFWDWRKNIIEKYFQLDGTVINEGCNRLFIDSRDRLWISTWLFSAYIKEPGKPIKKIPYSQNETYTIGYGHFREAIEDEEGNVWLGTINGVSKSQDNYPLLAIYQLPSFRFFLQTGFAQANHISVWGDTIMASKEEGIVAYNMADGSYKRFIVPTLLRNRFLMSVRQNDTWWFAGDEGLYKLKNGSSRLEKLNLFRKDPSKKFTNFVFVDHEKKVWFQVMDDAVYCFDPQTKKLERFDGKDETRGIFTFANCQSFVQLRNNNIYFSRNGRGFLKFDYAAKKFSELPVFNPNEFYVSKLVEDSDGNIWASAAGRGILKMNQKGAVLDSIDTSSGLLFDHIASIGIDDRGAVWAASREGLMFFNPKTKAVTKVEIDLGKTLQDYWNNLTIANGKVYAVMLDHVVVIDPFRFAVMPVKKAPHITSVKIFGTEKTPYENEGILELEPTEDDMTFQYASLSHRDIPWLQYSFQLEGVDKHWVNAGRRIVASYTNLMPGKYTFKVRSTDEKGQWMKEETVLKVHIKPNWWQTWWFTALCLLVLLLISYMFYRDANSRKEKRRIDKTIDYFANSVYGENSVNEICWDIARNCISQLRFEDCVVYLLDEEKNRLVQKAAYGPKNPKGHEIINPIEIDIGMGIVGAAAASGKPLIIGDTTKDDRYIIDDEVRYSEIAVPIHHDGKVIGVIDSEHSRKYFFTDEHAKALTTIASISANKISEAIAEGQAQEKEIMLLEINKMLAESQLMALRAQMNPHFVFNCLNSIQECIVTQKYGEASKYLNKFSKLFRMVLNNSGKNLVTVEEEREVLELYLELEQMRFENSFCYNIIMDETLEEDQISLPSMLVQPYVENALWHGLMHKSGERRLTIEFKRVDEETFVCRIDDNGIGRKKSFELKEKNSKSKRHESRGLAISQDRIDLLQRQGNHARLTITDKYDEGKAIGTLVEIELSTYLKNL
ncbi:Sensor histidine kinase, LytS/YehU family [Dyadobacter koreensis]|uniref:Sensor histidine kinase, LytS/YehU family n=1 Tax=Dyadobacter koreensis TaxID=408657 RepID=A0A1H6T447_9BACT|nr:histidine kinase [Dyadobacter koreensis]SEI74909.1 Sensor histidine kinase, LytS/YehU family [Dyadobacter koreensis]